MKRCLFLSFLLFSSSFVTAEDDSESSIDLRESTAPMLEKVREKSMDKVPDLIDALPLARGYKDLLGDPASDAMSDLNDQLAERLNEKLAQYQEKVMNIVSEELSFVPRDNGQDFFSSYMGVTSGRMVGSWDHGLADNPFLRGHVAGAFLGFGQFFNSNLYLGSETFFNFLTGVYYPYKTFKYREHYNFGLTVLPGYQVYHGFVYLRTGAVYGRVSRTINPADDHLFDVYRFGYQLGLGYNFYATRRWHFRLDYAHNGYSDVTITSKRDGNKYEFSPSSNLYTVAAVYYLNPLNIKAISSPDFPLNRVYVGFFMDMPNHFQDDSRDAVPGVAVAEEETSALEGYLGGLELGYLFQIGQSSWFVGGEAFVSITDRDFEPVNERTTSWRNTFSSGGSVLAGYRVKRSNIVYLRTGASVGTFEKEGQKDETMSKIALQYGAGGETVVTKRFSFRVEYSRDRYADMTPSDEHFTFAVNFYI